MMEGLREKIVATGYWRVNFRPLATLPESLAFAECEAAIDRSRVELRGWDFPHVSRRQDDAHGYARAVDYVENWIEWDVHVEFWRMYRSSQFLHYRALWEDLDSDRDNGRPRQSAKVLSVGSAIYTITEIFEFIFRLHRSGLYQFGATLQFSLENSFHRQLWINDPNRAPFSEDKITGATRIPIDRSFSSADLEGADHKLSMSAILELFSHFGWDAAESTIVGQQTRFLSRQI
ncbi:MAG: hypothetical protein WEB63_01345 [Cucumibacter sp.]